MARVKHGLPSSSKPAIRRELALRDGCECYICGEPLILNNATIDHFDNDNTATYNDISNLRLCCGECNGKKSLFEALLKKGLVLSDKSIVKLCSTYSYFKNVVKARNVHSRCHR